MCHELGVVIEFLPPYSPDFNPIEEAFAELKAWMKKHRKLTDTVSTLGEFAELALENLENNAAGHFVQARTGQPLREGSEEDYWND